MSLEKTIADWFEQNNFMWSVKDKGYIIPTETEVEAALDEAARILYAEPVDTQLAVGRLHIVRTEKGHDVFMYIGSYE